MVLPVVSTPTGQQQRAPPGRGRPHPSARREGCLVRDDSHHRGQLSQPAHDGPGARPSWFLPGDPPLAPQVRIPDPPAGSGHCCQAHPAPVEWQRVPGTSGLSRSEPRLNQLLGTCVTANRWRGGHGAGPPGHRTGRGWAHVSSVHPRSRPFLTTLRCVLRRPQHTGVSPRLAGPSLTWTLEDW